MTVKQRIRRVRRRYHRRVEAWRQALSDRIDREERERDERIRELRRKQRDKGEPFTMFDSIDLSQMPAKIVRPDAAAGYTGGAWPTFPEIVRRYPDAHHLSIAVRSADAAECLDVEPGDATNEDVPGWIESKAQGKRPVIYTFLSNAQVLVNYLAAHGIDREEYDLWIAHWTGKPHICGPSCGFGLRGVADATQFTDHSGGRNLDESLCAADFHRGGAT